MIPKKDLIDGRYYNGICRNATLALWNEKEQMFFHLSYAFGYYMDKIEHFEDVKEKRLDGFIPIEIIEPIDYKEINRIRNEVGY